MPELPEVETTRRGIAPHLIGHAIEKVIVRESRLRWPVPDQLSQLLQNRITRDVRRRGKYLIADFDNGHLLLHLGMSGSLRIVAADSPPRKHDHIDWILSSGNTLRFHDPRRFGSLHWIDSDPSQHALLKLLGPEPLDRNFNGDHLFTASRGRKTAVKNFIMDSHTVVGVGNIYASEALFLAGIRPGKAAGRVSLERYRSLAQTIKQVLKAAIRQGGTTLRDFVNERGQPGYFRQKLNVYEKAGQPCPQCKLPIKKQVIGQRSSYFCSHCQQ